MMAISKLGKVEERKLQDWLKDNHDIVEKTRKQDVAAMAKAALGFHLTPYNCESSGAVVGVVVGMKFKRESVPRTRVASVTFEDFLLIAWHLRFMLQDAKLRVPDRILELADEFDARHAPMDYERERQAELDRKTPAADDAPRFGLSGA